MSIHTQKSPDKSTPHEYMGLKSTLCECQDPYIHAAWIYQDFFCV